VETRRVQSVSSDTSCAVDRPFSEAMSQLPFIVRYVTGKGYVSNDGSGNTLTGTGTTFSRDLNLGWTIAVGDETRVVTQIVNDTQLLLSGPFNLVHGGVSQSGWAFESCMSTAASTRTYSIDTCELKPGCCGFKLAASVRPQNFAYYQVVPSHASMDVRVVMASTSNNLEMFMRIGLAPDDKHHDYMAVSASSPWQLEMPRFRMNCNATAQGPACDPIVIGIRATGTAQADVQYELSSFAEFNFGEFSCLESTEATASARCESLGLKQLGNATVVLSDDTTGSGIMQLTPEATAQTGALWWGTKMHVQNGFETSFHFKVSSSCSPDDSTD